MKTKYGKSVGSMSLNIVGSCLLIAAMLVLGASAAQAGVIYHDDFSGISGTSIDGKAPDTAPGSEVWGSGTSAFTYDGAGAAVLSLTSAQLGGTGRSQHLPLTIEPGLKYTLTARIKNEATTDDDWIAIGWAQTDSHAVFSNDDNPGHYWMLWRGSDKLKSFEGPRAGGQATESDNHPGEGDELDVRIILDQLADTPTAYFQYKNPSASVWIEHDSTALTQTQLDAITRVGFAATPGDANDRRILSFTLEAIPEPGSGIIFVTAGVLLWLARRRYNA